METLILHTTRGTLNPKTLEGAQAMHNAFVMEGPQPGIAVARSLGDLSHTLYTPVEGRVNLSAASPGELLFIDSWADPVSVIHWGRPMLGRPEVVSTQAEGACTCER